ncbi:CHASE domain-containing protein [Pseudomonas sp. PH1b]|uniref:CHASE domain-containing hybrid sensor histidine kinase/response regulator n=1 Tax=Pseudomonas sp. PH1b TaxID=1397282 RepID=UPI000468B2A7|nr:CHASE domain-containing protein [Pseudomonas sp. PH1b]
MKVKSFKWSVGWMLFILFAGLTASYGVSFQRAKAIETHVELALKDAGEAIDDNLQTRLKLYEYRLRAMRGAIQMLNLDYVSNRQMARFGLGRDLEKEYPGAYGFGFIRRVPSADEEKFMRNVRADGQPEFKLTLLGSHPGDRFIIQFIDPLAGNSQILGLDIASEVRRREAAIEAMRTGASTLTAPITLQQDAQESQRAFLLLSPVYDTPVPPLDAELREKKLIGWTYTPLSMHEVLAGVEPGNHRLHLRLYDVGDTRQLIYQTPENSPDPKILQVYSFEREIYGRHWRIEVGALQAFVDTLDPVPAGRVFAIGAVASFLLASLVGALLISRQRKQQVRAGQARLATIVENSSDAIIGEALDGRIITWNRAAEQMFGYTEYEVLGQPLAPLLVPVERVHEDEQLLEQAARGDRGSTLETQRQHKEGRLIDVTITCSLIREADGTILGAAKTMHDVTDRKRVERYLMEFNAQLEKQVSERTAELFRLAGLMQAVLDASSEVSIIATDTQGQIVVFNRGAELLLGYSHAEMVRCKTPMDFHLSDEVEARSAELTQEYGIPIKGIDVFCYKAALLGSETRQWTYVRKDGSKVQVSMVITPIRTADGELTGHLGIAQDVTDRLRHSAELQTAKAAAEAANAAKSLFLANMSHEIRTPMNAVIGIAHLLQNSSLDEQQRQLLTKLQIAGRSLLGIINDILDIAKIEAGEMRLEHNPFSPRQLLDELGELFTAQAEQKGLSFAVEGGAELPGLLVGDALRINQILMNLVGNALKFTTQGRVEVIVTHESDATDHCWLSFSVQDTGCGIDADALGQLFTPFTQADASTTRRFGGTGLGLSVVHGLVEQMRGNMLVHSDLGCGSKFQVSLPFKICSSELEAVTTGESLEVLMLCDDGVMAQALRRVCRSLGWRVSCMADEQALFRLLQERYKAQVPLPDVLLLDWHSPMELDLQRLHESTQLPIILVTQSATEAALSDHVDHVLPSPLDSSALFNAVNACIAKYHGNTERVLQFTRLDIGMTHWLSGLQILLVDDSEINLEVATLLLEQQGAQVHTCVNGLQALERLRQAPEFFDVVLMDVQMPEMDGYEATRRVRNELGLKNLPMLALTAGALAEERLQAECAGMDDFLTKPLEPSALIRSIRRAVERVRGTSVAVSAIVLPQGETAEEWPVIEGFNIREAANRLGNDVQLFRSSIRRFFNEFAGFSDSVVLLQVAQQPTLLIADLHKLRGAAALLGATAVGQLAGQAESLLRDGRAADSVLSALSEAFSLLLKQAANVHETAMLIPSIDMDQEQARQALASLRAMLQSHDLAALDQFAVAAPLLHAAAGQVLVERLWQSIEELQFERALQMLESADL